MVAKENNLNRFLQEREIIFVIPVYQRNYDWTEKQCSQLYFDILQVAKDGKRNSHFIGSIVYIHEGLYSATRKRELTIIDGQQRLTTVTLLWAAMYHYLKSIGEEKRANKIYEKYLEDDGDLKLRTTSNNQKVYHFILEGKADQEDYHKKTNMVDNYKFFRTNINEHNIDLIEEGINKLLYVDISLDRERDEPQRIFESLNSTGLDLSQGDLIRNYVLMELKSKEQNIIYRDYWKDIEKNTTNSNNNELETSSFLRHFLTFTNREIPNKTRVYEKFKENFPDKKFDDLLPILKKLKTYSRYYSKLINSAQEPDEAIRQQINFINKIEINVSYPFLLEVYHDYETGKISKEIFIEVFELIQSFAWRRFVVGLPTNSLNKIFTTLYRDIDYDNYLESLQLTLLQKKGTQRFPDDDEISRELEVKDMYHVKSKNRTYCLGRLENHNNREPVKIEGNKDITVEHIFPQTPNTTWRRDLGKEEFDKMKERVNTLANLTLSGNNGSLGNKSFVQKRDLDEKGYADSRLFLNRFLGKKDYWTPKELKARHKILVKRIFEIWTFPDIELPEIEDEDAVNIFDVDDPTNSKIDHALWENEELFVGSHRELLEQVAINVFEENQHIFFTTDLGARLKLTKKDNDLNTPIKMDESYYIEGGLSAKEIFSRVKYILSTCEIEEILKVKLTYYEKA
jgi:uncharacterized protein with ParB-like and HNH nuclease domain